MEECQLDKVQKSYRDDSRHKLLFATSWIGVARNRIELETSAIQVIFKSAVYCSQSRKSRKKRRIDNKEINQKPTWPFYPIFHECIRGIWQMKRAVGLGIQSEPPPIPGGLSSDSHRRDLFLLVGDAQAASGCLRLPAGPTLLTGLQLQEPLNVGLIVADAAGRVVAVHGLALFIYQKLLVVPTDVAVADGRVVKPGTIEERVARLRAASLHHVHVMQIWKWRFCRALLTLRKV